MSQLAAATDRSATIPQISIIVPLAEHRGQALAAVESWVERQSLEGEAFELIVVDDGADPQLAQRVAAKLRPRDRLLTCPDSLLALYNHGARHALGKWLLLTESHVIAQPDCLAELLRYLREESPEGACCASQEIAANRYAAMEGRLYQRSWPERVASWDRVVLRGVAIRRDIFLGSGGFPAQFGHYAELVFGAALHDLGFRLGYAERARVGHFNTQSPEEMEESLLDYAHGEIAYRAEGEPHLLDDYLGSCPLWERREFLRPENARWLVGLLLGRLLREPGGGPRGRAYRAFLLRHAPAALLGAGWGIGVTRCGRSLARLGAILGSAEGKFAFHCYRRYWESTLRLGRRWAVAEYLATHRPVPETPVRRCEFGSSQRDSRPVEMNWCRVGGIGLLQLSLPPGKHRLAFDWRASRGLFETVFAELVLEQTELGVLRLRGQAGTSLLELEVPETASGSRLRRIAWLMPELPDDVRFELLGVRSLEAAALPREVVESTPQLTRRQRLQRAA